MIDLRIEELLWQVPAEMVLLAPIFVAIAGQVIRVGLTLEPTAQRRQSPPF
jgi:hypothetical protein